MRPLDPVTGRFLHALQSAYGNSMAKAIAGELALHRVRARPLRGTEFRRAVELGEAGRPALAGVDFGTRLRLSAVVNAPGFRQIVQDLGLTDTQLTPQARHAIDVRMAQRFERARLAGLSPVPEATAEKWLRSDLSLLTV